MTRLKLAAASGPSLLIALGCAGIPNQFQIPDQLRYECELPPSPVSSDVGAQAIAPVRQGAIEGFDSLDATFDLVEGPFPEVRGCTGVHTQGLTNSPGNRIEGAHAEPWRHLSQLTFIADTNEVAVGDLFLHGDGDGYIAIRSVDLRKFLYQDVVLRDCDAEPCDNETLPGAGSEWKRAEPAPKGYAGEPFDSDRFECIRQVHGFFAEFNRIAKRIPQVGGDGDLRLHLTNNCREPGNYEFALVSEEHGKVFKDHASLDIEFYSEILQSIDVELGELGTGIRVVGTERRSDGTYAYVDVVEKEFPSGCELVNLAPYIGKAQRLVGEREIRVETGAIPYDEFSSETNEKSGLTNETIVYVEVDRKQPPIDFKPHGFWFQKASDGVILRRNENKRWRDLVDAELKGGDVWAPHTFATFADVLERPFAISAFEVDGRYLGRMPEERLTDDTLRLYGFDYSFLKDFRRAEIRMAIKPNGKPDSKPPRMEFRLLDEGCSGKDCVNLIVGNIQLEPGESTSMVLGIGTQPLSEDYEKGTYQTAQQYALTYDANGEITELTKHGLGLAVVRRGRSRKGEYTIDFVAYERAVPLWRGVIDLEERPGQAGAPRRSAPQGRRGR